MCIIRVAVYVTSDKLLTIGYHECYTFPGCVLVRGILNIAITKIYKRKRLVNTV